MPPEINYLASPTSQRPPPVPTNTTVIPTYVMAMVSSEKLTNRNMSCENAPGLESQCGPQPLLLHVTPGRMLVLDCPCRNKDSPFF